MKKALIALLAALGCGGSGGPQRVSINFRASVGTRAFSCQQTYAGLGTKGTTWTPQDFRLYVNGVRLVTAAGVEVPVSLDDDGVWQDGTVGLLDFEDKTGTCGNGTSAMNTKITGSVAPGDYTGLKFVIGVPFDRDHLQVDSVRAPLNLSPLYWTWTSGYMFMRLDGSFLLHLGSGGCQRVDPNDVTKGVSSCSSPNAPEIELAAFNPARDTVVLDVAGLFAGTDLTQAGDLGGCMSDAADAACVGPLTALGLKSAAQTFVRAE